MGENVTDRKHAACLAAYALAVCVLGISVMLVVGCTWVGDVCEAKGCPNPDDPDNSEDAHWCFEFETPSLDFDPSRGSPPSPVPELEDFAFMWSYFYNWDSCEDSTPGMSGEFTVRWKLEVNGAIEWECSDTAEPYCDTDNVLMGTSSSGLTPIHPGLEVPGNDPRDYLSCVFCVMLDVDSGQECTGDLIDRSCSTLTSNENCLQFTVINCPCGAGHDKKDLLVSDLTLAGSPGDGDTIEWTNTYEWAQCGQEADQITEESGAFTERITITPVAGGQPAFVQNRSAPSVPLNSSETRSIAMPDLNQGVYDIKVELLNIGTDVECEDTAGNNEATIRVTI